MKKTAFALLTLLLFVLSGCGTDPSAITDNHTISEKVAYHSDISAEDCYLCGDGIENVTSVDWGQNNVALISLNTFEIKPIEINRYDRSNERLIEEYAGVVSFGGDGSTDGGFSASLMVKYDRGYATAPIPELTDSGNSSKLEREGARTMERRKGKKGTPPPRYDEAFKAGAERLVTEQGRQPVEVAKECQRQ